MCALLHNLCSLFTYGGFVYTKERYNAHARIAQLNDVVYYKGYIITRNRVSYIVVILDNLTIKLYTSLFHRR